MQVCFDITFIGNPIKKKHMFSTCAFSVNYAILAAANLANQAAGFLPHPCPLICPRYWDLLLTNKDEIIKYLSAVIENLSENILCGTDNITFAKLVYAFNVHIIQRNDGDGISFTNPIPTYSDKYFSKKSDECEELFDLFNSQTDIQKKI